MIPETTKDPGSICTIASASRVFLICIILPVTFIQSQMRVGIHRYAFPAIYSYPLDA